MSKGFQNEPYIHGMVVSAEDYGIFGWDKYRYKGNGAFADLRYGEEDSISPSTLIFPATKG